MQTLEYFAYRSDRRFARGKLLVVLCLLMTAVFLSGCTPIEERRPRRVRTVTSSSARAAEESVSDRRITDDEETARPVTRRSEPRQPSKVVSDRSSRQTSTLRSSKSRSGPAIATVRRGSSWSAVLAPASAGSAQPTRATADSAGRLQHLRDQARRQRREDITEDE